LGLVCAAQATALWQVQLGFGAGVGIGVGFTYVPSLATVQRWFVRRRGLASGLAVSGIGLGTLVMPLVAAPLIDQLGWRWAWVALGVTIIVVGGGASLFLYSSPERYGLLPDGDGLAAAKPSSDKALGLWKAVTSRTFLWLYLALVAISIGAFTPFVHLVPFAEDVNLTHGTAIFILGLIGVGSTLGRFLVAAFALLAAVLNV
jgi:MFS family permease